MALKIIANLNNPNAGVNVSYTASVPDNSLGANGDVCILTTNGSHYKKIAGVWTIQLGETTSSTAVLTYVDRTALLTAAGSSANKLGIATTEPGNMYLRNAANDKWIVLSGNSYPSVDLPTTPNFDIPVGAPVFNSTSLKWVYE